MAPGGSWLVETNALFSRTERAIGSPLKCNSPEFPVHGVITTPAISEEHTLTFAEDVVFSSREPPLGDAATTSQVQALSLLVDGLT
jgi:hypothetical protein